jgi:predicted PurR-regulated permease PerM
VAVGILLGALVAFVLQPFFVFLRRHRLSPVPAAAISAAGSVAFIGAWILGVGFILISRGLVLVAALPEAVAPGGSLHPLAKQVARMIGTLHVAPADDPLSRVREGIGSVAYHTTGLAAGVGNAIASTGLTLFFLGLAVYYVLLNWPDVIARAERGLPFDPLHTRALFGEFKVVGKQVLFGTVSTGLIQGVLATLGFWITGVPEAIFLGAVTAAVSLLPGIGVMLVWFAMGVFRILTGHVAGGVTELIWGAVVVSLIVDTVIRPRLVGRGHLPAIFTFVGLIGGVQVFGLIGLIVGPVVVSLCVALLRIYDREVVLEGEAEAPPP